MQTQGYLCNLLFMKRCVQAPERFFAVN